MELLLKLNSTVQPFTYDFTKHKLPSYLRKKEVTLLSVRGTYMHHNLSTLQNRHSKMIVFIREFYFHRQYFTEAWGPTSVVHMVATNKGLQLDDPPSHTISLAIFGHTTLALGLRQTETSLMYIVDSKPYISPNLYGMSPTMLRSSESI